MNKLIDMPTSGSATEEINHKLLKKGKRKINIPTFEAATEEIKQRMSISSYDSTSPYISSYEDDSETQSNDENKNKLSTQRKKKTLKRQFVDSSDEDKQNHVKLPLKTDEPENNQKHAKLTTQSVQNDVGNNKKASITATKRQTRKKSKKGEVKIEEKKEKQYILGGQIFKESLLLSHFKNALNHTPIIFFPCPCQSKNEK